MTESTFEKAERQKQIALYQEEIAELETFIKQLDALSATLVANTQLTKEGKEKLDQIPGRIAGLQTQLDVTIRKLNRLS